MTVTVWLACEEVQAPLVPVNVYVVVADGVTVIELFVTLVDQEYEDAAPTAVKVTDVPAQIGVDGEAVIETDGVCVTFTCNACELTGSPPKLHDAVTK